MIVDLRKSGRQRFLTETIASVELKSNGYWDVLFKDGNRRQFRYSNLLYLTRSGQLNLGEKGLYIGKRQIGDLEEILIFKCGLSTFYRVVHRNGYVENFEDKEVYITRSALGKDGRTLWDYLKKTAEETGLIVKGEDGVEHNVLPKQYDLVDLTRDTVPLFQYLGNEKKSDPVPLSSPVYYPFGCNSSQKMAVERALENQVSIVQGPPGTGKTQTILNVVANLLMAKKTVLVVSNNNSAVENVAEKLESEGLGFLVAKLGRQEYKQAFIDKQNASYPDMSSWTLDKQSLLQKEKKEKEALEKVSRGFEAQIAQAKLKAEREALSKETQYDKRIKTGNLPKKVFKGRSSTKLMGLLSLYEMMIEKGEKPSFWFRTKQAFVFGPKMFFFLSSQSKEVTDTLTSSYYFLRKAEIERELKSTESKLKAIDLEKNLKELRSCSLQILKNKIAQRYGKRQRKTFAIEEIKSKTEEFLKEYPVVLSTTYSAKKCISKNMVFDYVIMDEASQVNIETGVLALSCANNAVIVGDDKQLPNVVSSKEKNKLQVIQNYYDVKDCYNSLTHSFLQSCVEVFKDFPVTLLREHYRCHPKIIEFCNKRFYNGELIAMSTDKGEEKVLQVVRTVKGNHARGHFNQREIDVIVQEVMPEYSESAESVGIITPYREQAKQINDALGRQIASTVHKYQGRECETIIMDTVDNEPTEFSDDSNLMNVAISRAKNRLCVVTTGNEIAPESNLAQLIAYIDYNNFEVRESKICSVFDLLYKQYTVERLAYQKAHCAVSKNLSENLVYDLLVEAIEKTGQSNIEVLLHYPLSRLVGNWSLLSEQEKGFAENPLSHVDFLVYNSLTKQAVLAIEVDGWGFHGENKGQQERDRLKDSVFDKIGLRLRRISTTEAVDLKTIEAVLP